MKFRKRPVVIEAIQFDGTVESGIRIRQAYERDDIQVIMTGQHINGGNLSIPTLEGVMNASPGDWIIQGVSGEIYPCKPDIFAKTYEHVESEAKS